VDGRGVPLSLVVTGANVHDCKRLDEVLTSAWRPPSNLFVERASLSRINDEQAVIMFS
jgi:hypothetical protein